MIWRGGAALSRAIRALLAAVLPVAVAGPTTGVAPQHHIRAHAPFEVVASGLHEPTGIARNPRTGDLFVAEAATGVIVRIGPNGLVHTHATGFQRPRGLARDPRDGSLLVVDEKAGTLSRIDPLGAVAVLRDDLEKPHGVAVDEAGTLYVTAEAGGGFNLAGDERGVLLGFAPDGTMPRLLARGFLRPGGLRALPGGRVRLVADRLRGEPERGGGTVFEWTPADGQLTVLVRASFRRPHDLALDALAATYLTADRQPVGGRPHRGVLGKAFHADGVGLLASGLQAPQGLLFDPQGHLYVAEADAGTILRFLAPGSPALDPAPPAFTREGTITLLGRAEPNAVIAVRGAADPALPPQQDVTAHVRLQRGRLRLHAPATFVERVTLTPTGPAPLAAPLAVVAFDLPPGVTLANATTTIGGRPAREVPLVGGFLRPGERASAVLQFHNPARVSFTAPLQVWALTPAAVSDGAGHFAVPVVPAANAENHLEVFQTAALGLGLTSAPARATVVHDDTPPGLTITEPREGTVLDSPFLTVRGTIIEANLEAVTVNGRAARVVDGMFEVPNLPLAEGPNVLTAAARDKAGNTGETAVTVTRVSAPPTITITEPPAGAITNQLSVTVRGTVGGINLQRVTVNGVLAALTAGTYEATGVPLPAEGPNPLTATVLDGLGRTASATVTLVRDTLPPVIRITAPALGAATNQLSLTVRGAVDDATLDRVSVNGLPASLAAGTFEAAGVPLPAEGLNRLTASATDRAGNTAAATVAVIRATQGPRVTITSPGPGTATNQSSVRVLGTAKGGTAVTSVSVNGSPATLVPPPPGTLGAGVTFVAGDVPLPLEGPNTLTITATDALGNLGTAHLQVTRDTGPPTVRLLSPAAGAVLAGTAMVEVEASEGAGTGIARLTIIAPPGLQDTEPPPNLFRALWDTRTLPDGPFTVTAEARDAAGNITRASADVLIANAGRFTPAPTLPNPRAEHSATLLNDGTVYLFGGRDAGGAPLDTALRFDVSTGQYSAVPGPPAPNPQPRARQRHTATLLPTGHVLVVGGDGLDMSGVPEVLGSAELHDPLTGTVTPLAGALGTPRRDHTATLLLTGEVLIVGGEDATGRPLASVETFDPKAGTFRAHPASLAAARSAHSATLLPDGRALILGGRASDGALLDGAEAFDPASNAFAPRPELRLPEGREGHTATLLPSGEILVAGGRTAAGPTASALIVSLAPVGVRPFAPLGAPRAAPAAALLPGGEVLLAGGEGPPVLETGERFVPAPDTLGPAVAEVQPAPGSRGVTRDVRIAVRFTEPVDPRTLTPTALTVTGPSGPVAGALSAGENGLLAFFIPAAPLEPGAGHALTLTGDLRDMAGNALAPATVLFSTQPVAPVITGVTPLTIPQGGTATITISGDKLAGATAVTALLADAPDPQVSTTITATSPTSLRATVTAAAGAALGPRTLVVASPQGESPRQATPFNTLSVVPALPAGPVIVAFDPASGPVGTAVTIHGRNFGATPAENLVTFAGVTQPRVPATVEAASPARLEVRVPSGAQSGPVTVQVGGLTSNAFLFVVEGAPARQIAGPLGSIQVDGSPTGVAIHQGLNLAVVAQQAAGTAVFLDLATRQVVGQAPIGGQPGAVAALEGLAQALVGNGALRELARLDVAGRRLVDRIGLLGSATDVATLPGFPLAFAAQPAVNQVQVVDVAAGAVFPFGIPGVSPTGVALDGPTVWVVDRGTRTLAAFGALPPFPPAGTVALPADPERIAIHLPLRRAVVTLPQANQVAVVDLAARQVLGTVPVGASPKGAAISQGRGLALVANFGDNSVSIIELLSRVVVATVPAGQGPTGIAVHEPSQLAAVTNTTDGTVTLIDLKPPSPALPEVTSVTPASGPVGTLVTIRGTGFDASPGGPTVTFSSALGRVLALVLSASPTELVAQVPDGGITGPVGVVTRNGSTLSRQNFLVTGNPLRVRIASPADGAVIPADRVDVAGVVDLSTATVGVTVNGLPAQVSGNAFLAANVPLDFGGPTVLTATGVDEHGQQATASATVQGTAEPPAATLTASPPGGEAPLAVTFTLRLDSPLQVRTFDLDFEGDGVVDQTFPDQFPPSVPFTYPREGVYHPTVTLTDAAGRRFSASTVVSVVSLAFFRAQWNGLKAALIRNDIAGALLFLTEAQRPAYREAFAALGARLPQIARDWGDIQFVYLRDRRAKFRLLRDEVVQGQTVSVTYYVYFVQDAAGRWRIESF